MTHHVGEVHIMFNSTKWIGMATAGLVLSGTAVVTQGASLDQYSPGGYAFRQDSATTTRTGVTFATREDSDRSRRGVLQFDITDVEALVDSATLRLKIWETTTGSGAIP